MPEETSVKTLVLLKGHHSTLVRGIAPHELHQEIEEARLNKTPFYFLQDAGVHPECSNGVCIDPESVVALVRVDH